jgi:dolichol-phosphate mannosyltransferase
MYGGTALSIPLLSVVIPLQNEAANLPELYRRLAAAAQGLCSEARMEMVFVDDGSTDQSLTVLKELAARDERVTVVQLTRNWGSHAAVKAGLRVSKGDCCAAISADLQDPPEMLADLFHAHQKGFQVVWGTRATRKDPWLKTLWAKAFYAVFSRLALSNLPAGGVDVFLISRRVYDELLELRERNNPPYYQILWLGFPYVVVPYHRAARAAGVSKWSFRRRLKMAGDALISFTPAPLKAAAYAGGTSLAAAIIWGLCWILALVQGSNWAGSIVGPLLCLLAGIQLLATGILGEYLWRVALDVRQRPESCIEQVIRHAHQSPRQAA